jgi:hypothetical protein
MTPKWYTNSHPDDEKVQIGRQVASPVPMPLSHELELPPQSSAALQLQGRSTEGSTVCLRVRSTPMPEIQQGQK